MLNIKEKILFKTYSGSKLYGTDISGKSDVDIKGVFLPNLNDLILGTAPKHYTFSTGDKHLKNTAEDIDETYYSLQYFLELVSKGETNAIDMLFAYTNKNAVIYEDATWNILIKNIDKLVTKNIKSYLGFCVTQCNKYSFKGDKLNNYLQFKEFCIKYNNEKDINGVSISLEDALKDQFINIENCFPIEVDDRKKFNTSIDDKFQFGDHFYIEMAKNGEILICISSIKFQLRDSVKTSYHKIMKVINSYGERSITAANADGADMKAISHCVRVIFQVKDLLINGKITFPLKEAEFIKDIKYNTTTMSFIEIMNWIENELANIDNLLTNCLLRNIADHNFIENFILNFYKK